MTNKFIALLVLPVFALAADNLELLRDKQDRGGLAQAAASITAAAEKNPEMPTVGIAPPSRKVIFRKSPWNLAISRVPSTRLKTA